MPPADSERPDPDRLLARIERDRERAQRGRLRVYFGASPGVGKTFAMLSEAHRLAAQGTDVVIGLVETHGRAETQQLAQGLETLPRRRVEYRGTELTELHLDRALARRPAVLLVDELAHTNAPGSRFGKRWQDVRALLDAGISVHTTLNVQHVESLVDVVARLTGVTVRETVPDAVLDEADEVEIVDLAPDALLERLRAGKVYVPETARAAAASFFKAGNLAALRELALRKTAQLVDQRRREDRSAAAGSRRRAVHERVLVCVGPSPSSARLVRAAHRMAAVMRAELLALFVAPPGGGGLSAAARERVRQNLRIAESLGARTAEIEGRDPAVAIVAFAERHEVSRIVVGKTGRSRLHDLLFGSFTMAVIRASRDTDVYVIHAEPEEEAAPRVARGTGGPSSARSEPGRWLAALAITAATIVIAWAMFDPPDLATEAMLLVLGTVAAAFRCGRWPALCAALLHALAFNFLMTEPRFSFAVADPSYLLAFVVMALVGVSIGTLVGAVRERATAARERESETAVLHSLARELAAAATVEEIGRAAVAHLRDVVRGELALFVPEADRPLHHGALVAAHGSTDWLDDASLAVARWSHDHGKTAGVGTTNLPGTPALFVPLASHRGREAVLGIRPPAGAAGLTAKQRVLVDTFAGQTAAALERVGLAEERHHARHEADAERLRSTLLSSVSHDLRTPLTTITGAASSLADEATPLDESARRALAADILGEARRLEDLIANLMFATRLEAGDVALRRQWTSVEEVVGSALARAPLDHHDVGVDVGPQLPLLDTDPVLLQQALYNLLENAVRHTPPGTRVEVRAWCDGGSVVVEVADHGPGVPPSEHDRVFRRFSRGDRSAGMGLGLAITASIANAHGGRAWLDPGRACGAAFRLSLPVPAAQPHVPLDEDAELPAAEPAPRASHGAPGAGDRP